MLRAIAIFFFLFSEKVFSQNQFYLRPTLTTDAYFSHSEPSRAFNPSFFEYKTKQLGYLFGAEAGLMMGYQFNWQRTSRIVIRCCASDGYFAVARRHRPQRSPQCISFRQKNGRWFAADDTA